MGCQADYTEEELQSIEKQTKFRENCKEIIEKYGEDWDIMPHILKQDLWWIKAMEDAYNKGKSESELTLDNPRVQEALINKELGKQEALKEVKKLIENERIYPDYRGLSIEEALTQFKVRVISKLTEKGK